MLCEITQDYGFLTVWFVIIVLGMISMVILSGAVFYPYYVKPTIETWQYKNNPKYPSPQMVKKEIIHTGKGLITAAICPALTLVASQWGWSQGYCGFKEKAPNLFIQAFVIIIFSDIYEYSYHWMGHKFSKLWDIHRHHHMFWNPSPFSVIADEWADQLVRTLPLIILPAIMPTNMDLLFGLFSLLFYGYGVYLHWGFESKYLSAHNPIFNTAYHHYIHHAVSAIGRPYYTGFFFKIWDQLFGSNYPGPCTCYKCRAPRTKSEWEAIVKPDYSVLLNTSFWLKSYEVEVKSE
eukprot:gene7139-9740_t